MRKPSVTAAALHGGSRIALAPCLNSSRHGPAAVPARLEIGDVVKKTRKTLSLPKETLRVAAKNTIWF